MARFVKEYKITSSPETIFNAVHALLSSEGFEYTELEGENVFNNGADLLSPPTCFKLSFKDDTVRLEGWLRRVVLPGVHKGELDFDGAFFAVIAKKYGRKLAARIESVILQNGGSFINNHI